MNALRRCIRSGTEGIIVIECTWPGSTVSMLSRSCTHIFIIYITVKAQSKSNTRSIHLSFFFFLSPLAMDRRIAFSLLSISMHLSIVEFYAHYWIYNYSDLSNLYEIIIKTLSNFLSSYVEFLTFFSMHLVGILIRINDLL